MEENNKEIYDGVNQGSSDLNNNEIDTKEQSIELMDHQELDTNDKSVEENLTISQPQVLSTENEVNTPLEDVNMETTVQVEDINMETTAQVEDTNMETTAQVEDINMENAAQQDIHVEAKEKTTDKPIKKKRIRKFTSRHKTLCTLTGCLLLASVGGFGGAYFANSLNDDASLPVMYQSSGTPVKANSGSKLNVSDIAKATMSSVVEIQTESSKTSTFMEQYVEKGAGSGVVLTKDGYIITNHHVIDGASKVIVTTHDGKSYEAKLIGSDKQSDLALLKIDEKDLTPAVLGDSSKLNVGDDAIAIGNPLGQGATLTTGVISALDRDITIDGETMTLLQTNAAINPGNSGGGLFNSNGELIGIVNAKTSGSDIEGLGFAIPINDAKTVIEEIMKNGYVSNRAQLGVAMIDIQDEMSAMKAGVSELGVYISRVSEGSAAEKAGMKIKDQIIEIDGVKINNGTEAKTQIHKHKAGDKIEIKVVRDGKTITMSVTLDEATQDSNTENNELPQEIPGK